MSNLLVRDLKFVYFQYDIDKKEVLLRNKRTGQEVTFNKVYTFSTARFLTSVFQKMSVHHKIVRKPKE